MYSRPSSVSTGWSLLYQSAGPNQNQHRRPLPPSYARDVWSSRGDERGPGGVSRFEQAQRTINQYRAEANHWGWSWFAPHQGSNSPLVKGEAGPPSLTINQYCRIGGISQTHPPPPPSHLAGPVLHRGQVSRLLLTGQGKIRLANCAVRLISFLLWALMTEHTLTARRYQTINTMLVLQCLATSAWVWLLVPPKAPPLTSSLIRIAKPNSLHFPKQKLPLLSQLVVILWRFEIPPLVLFYTMRISRYFSNSLKQP